MAVFNAGNRPHRQHFYGNSTDTKPTNTYIGDLFYELDTGKTSVLMVQIGKNINNLHFM